MRPDEHKKRKSNQYKKKHGIATKGNEGSNKPPPGKGHERDHKQKVSTSEQAKGKPGAQSAVKSPGDRTKLELSDSSDSHSDSEACVPKKGFRRRQIVSNWDRYEQLPAEDEAGPSQRGESFTKLLSVTGDSLAQFRFQDEKDWEADVAGGSTPQQLCVDCDSLATALSCVPLHQRLGLDTNLFTESSIQEQNEQAKSEQEKYDKWMQSSTTREATHNVNIFQEDIEDTDLPPMVSKDSHLSTLLKPSSAGSESHSANNKQESNIKGPKVDLADKQRNSKSGETTVNSNKNKSPSVSKVVAKIDSELEEDLDFLLGLDKPQTSGVGDSAQTQEESRDVALGQMPVDAETIGDNKIEPKKDTVTEPKKDTEGLEDWLDSMLDD